MNRLHEVGAGQKQEQRKESELELNLDKIAEQHDQIESCLREYLNQEAIEQFIFVLQTLQEDDFINHCNDATEALGDRLNTSYGGETSFFSEAPTCTLHDLRSSGNLEKAGWTGKFHSVGVLKGKSLNHEPFFVIIDLTYSTVHKKHIYENSTFLVAETGEMKDALNRLRDIYGGTWSAQFVFKNGRKQFVG